MQWNGIPLLVAKFSTKEHIKLIKDQRLRIKLQFIYALHPLRVVEMVLLLLPLFQLLLDMLLLNRACSVHININESIGIRATYKYYEAW